MFCSVITKIQANDLEKLGSLIFWCVSKFPGGGTFNVRRKKKENSSHNPSKDQGHSHTMIACWLVVTKQHSPFGKFA